MQPVHMRDTMSVDDADFQSAMAASDDIDDAGNDSTADEYDVASTAFSGDTQEQSVSAHSPSAVSGRNPLAQSPSMSMSSPSSSLARPPRYVLPAGVTPHLISSSDTGEFGLCDRPGSTVVRRKTMSGHSIIAEATHATGNVMAGDMRSIAEAGRKLERSKIQVQHNLFDKQMEYNRERDRRLHENAIVVNENAKLAIHKQGQVVQCLVHIAHVLRGSLPQRNNPPSTPKPQPVPPSSTAETSTDGATPVADVVVDSERPPFGNAAAEAYYEAQFCPPSCFLYIAILVHSLM